MLAEVTALGPFFHVTTHPPGQAPAAPWRVLAELLDGGPALSERVHATRVALAASAGRPAAEIELRVAASVTQLGLAARLLSPALAAGVLSGEQLDLDPAGVWWQPVLGGPVPLSIPVGTGRVGVLAADGPIAALTVATQVVCPISPTVLWGNVASAVNGAATMIRAHRPDLAARADGDAAELLRQPPLRIENPRVGPGFRRRSCCLIYRVAAGPAKAICGDCVLGAPA